MTLNTDQPTLVALLLDRSGRMEKVRGSTITAFNTFIKTLKEVDSIEFTLILFDSEGLDFVHVCKPVSRIPRLTRRTYVPRAQSSLIEPTIKAIHTVAELLQRRDDNPKVVFCIQTRGERRPPAELRWDEVKALVENKAIQGWQFSVLAGGPNIRQYGFEMGIDEYRVLPYDHRDREKTRMAFRMAAGNIVGFASGSAADTRYDMHQYEDALAVVPVIVISADRPSVRYRANWAEEDD